MKVSSIILLASLVTALAAPAVAEQIDQNAKQEVEKVAAAYAAAIAKQDAAAVAALFTKDGVLATQAPAAGAKTFKVGPQEIEEYYQAGFKAGINHDEITVEQASPLGAGAIIAMGEYHVTGKGQNGPVSLEGHWTGVDVREGGSLKIRLLTAVPNVSPPK